MKYAPLTRRSSTLALSNMTWNYFMNQNFKSFYEKETLLSNIYMTPKEKMSL